MLQHAGLGLPREKPAFVNAGEDFNMPFVPCEGAETVTRCV
jgi:hypothetical protein